MLTLFMDIMATLLLVMVMVLAMAGMAMESVLLMLKLFMDIMALILFVNVMAARHLVMVLEMSDLVDMVELASMDKLSP